MQLFFKSVKNRKRKKYATVLSFIINDSYHCQYSVFSCKFELLFGVTCFQGEELFLVFLVCSFARNTFHQLLFT